MKLGGVMKVAKGEWYIIPRYYDWVSHHRSVEAERDVLVKIMTRPKRVRTGSFSASGAGQCLRRRQLAYLGYPQAEPDERTMNIFANGDYVHLRHQVAGLMDGYLTGAEVSVVNEEFNLTGTMDGTTDDEAIAEFKSINDRGFTEVGTYGVKTEHDEQVHSYMLASGLEKARVVYENKNDQSLKEFLVTRKPSTIRKVQQDLEILNEATDAKALLPMQGECVEGKGAFSRCPFKKICPMAKFQSARSASPRRSIRIPGQSSTPNA